MTWNRTEYPAPALGQCVRADLCFACLLESASFQLCKANPPFPANRYPKYKEVIAICNTPGIPFFRFLISFGPFAVSPGAIRRPVSARHCLRMPQMQPYCRTMAACSASQRDDSNKSG